MKKILLLSAGFALALLASVGSNVHKANASEMSILGDIDTYSTNNILWQDYISCPLSEQGDNGWRVYEGSVLLGGTLCQLQDNGNWWKNGDNWSGYIYGSNIACNNGIPAYSEYTVQNDSHISFKGRVEFKSGFAGFTYNIYYKPKNGEITKINTKKFNSASDFAFFNDVKYDVDCGDKFMFEAIPDGPGEVRATPWILVTETPECVNDFDNTMIGVTTTYDTVNFKWTEYNPVPKSTQGDNGWKVYDGNVLGFHRFLPLRENEQYPAWRTDLWSGYFKNDVYSDLHLYKKTPAFSKYIVKDDGVISFHGEIDSINMAGSYVDLNIYYKGKNGFKLLSTTRMTSSSSYTPMTYLNAKEFNVEKGDAFYFEFVPDQTIDDNATPTYILLPLIMPRFIGNVTDSSFTSNIIGNSSNFDESAYAANMSAWSPMLNSSTFMDNWHVNIGKATSNVRKEMIVVEENYSRMGFYNDAVLDSWTGVWYNSIAHATNTAPVTLEFSTPEAGDLLLNGKLASVNGTNGLYKILKHTSANGYELLASGTIGAGETVYLNDEAPIYLELGDKVIFEITNTTNEICEINVLAKPTFISSRKATAKVEVANYKELSLYRQNEQNQLLSIISNANELIDEALTYASINNIIVETKALIDSLKTKAEYESEEAELLVAAKTTAIAILNNYKNASDYRGAEQLILSSAIEDGIAAINACTLLDDVDAALDNAKIVIDGIKTKAEYEAEEAAALLSAKNTAKQTLNSYVNLEEYRTNDKATLQSLINDGNNAIDACSSIEDVNDALASALLAIDNLHLKTDAQLTEEEAAAALASYKETAKEDLKSYKSAENYEGNNKAIFENAVDEGLRAIENAKSNDEVDQALALAKANIDLIETISSKKGCSGSAFATSTLMFCLAFFGAALIFKKKRINNYER